MRRQMVTTMYNNKTYYVARVCIRYNARSDCLIVGNYSPVMPIYAYARADYGPAKTK